MLDEIRRPIEDEMRRLEEARERILSSENPLLALALSHVASRRGKMMRPMLVYLMEGRGGEALTHAALALEMLHTASLVHDDVVDESDRRRGQASVNALYDNQAAVLVGDYILSLALGEAARTGSTRFVEAMARLGQELSDGELLQLHCMDSEEVGEAQYYEVIRRKTASLFATCAAAGGYLRGEATDEAYRLGETIGIIFQMRDDLMDLDATGATGKPAGNDLREGKLTLPVIHAIGRDAGLREAAMRVRRGEATEADVAALTAAARQHGMAYAEGEMLRLTAEAHAIVDSLAAAERAAALHAYIDYAVKRNR